MFRRLGIIALLGLSLMTWGAPESRAVDPLLRPNRPGRHQKTGLQVTHVIPGTTAAREGIEPGDIITRVDGNPVHTLADLNLWVGQAGEGAELDVIDCNTGWLNRITVYPRHGRIGVAVRSVPLNLSRKENRRGRPIPLPLPVDPEEDGMHPLPLPRRGR
jgi:hypothetical protein